MIFNNYKWCFSEVHKVPIFHNLSHVQKIMILGTFVVSFGKESFDLREAFIYYYYFLKIKMSNQIFGNPFPSQSFELKILWIIKHKQINLTLPFKMSGILAFTLKHKDQLFTTLLFYNFFFLSLVIGGNDSYL